MNQARRNHHSVGSLNEEIDLLIYNDRLDYTGKVCCVGGRREGPDCRVGWAGEGGGLGSGEESGQGGACAWKRGRLAGICRCKTPSLAPSRTHAQAKFKGEEVDFDEAYFFPPWAKYEESLEARAAARAAKAGN